MQGLNQTPPLQGLTLIRVTLGLHGAGDTSQGIAQRGAAALGEGSVGTELSQGSPRTATLCWGGARGAEAISPRSSFLPRLNMSQVLERL